MTSENKGSIYVLLAGFLWGSMGLFVRPLTEMGLSSLQISSVRMLSAALCFNLLLAIKNPRGYRIEPNDILWFAAIGIGSNAVMTWSYFTSIQLTGMSVAAILLYTSPIWITIFARIFFKEKFTGVKLSALFLAFGGCCLVAGGGNTALNTAGIIMGLVSGLAYSLYSILGAVVLRKYDAMVVTTYAFTICAIGITIAARPFEIPDIVRDSGNVRLFMILTPLMGVVTVFLPYLLYTMGLKHLEVGKAGILATMGPLMATVFGVIVYKEQLTIPAAIGIAGILAANVLLNIKTKKASL